MPHDSVLCCELYLILICLDFFYHSSDESPDSNSTSPSIVFQNISQASPDAAPGARAPSTENQPVSAVVPMQEKGQVVCPKTMRCIPKNYVPCVFLGQQELLAGSKCPATGWESSAVLEEQSSRSSIELNNNACLNNESAQWSEICTMKPSKEVQ